LQILLGVTPEATLARGFCASSNRPHVRFGSGAVSIGPIANYCPSALGGGLFSDRAAGRPGLLNNEKLSTESGYRQRYDCKTGQQGLGEHGAISLARWHTGKLGTCVVEWRQVELSTAAFLIGDRDVSIRNQ